MDIILDTHILLWVLEERKVLSDEVYTLINDFDNNIYFSAISVMEVSIKHKKYPDQILRSGEDFYNLCLQSGFYTLPLKPKHAILMDKLNIKEGYTHNDPFDKALLAQAKQENFILLTHDNAFKNYDEKCIMLV